MITKTYKEEKAQAIAFLESIRNNKFEDALNLILENGKDAQHFLPEISRNTKSKDIKFLNSFLDFCNADRLDSVSLTILKSIYFAKNNKYNEALSILLEINQIKTNNPFILIFISNDYSYLKNYAKGIEFSNKIIELYPSFVPAYFISGIAYSNLSDLDKSIECYNKAIQLDPEFNPAYVHLGNVYNKRKDYEKAIEYCNKAIQLDPEYPDSFINLGNVYYSLKDYNKAIESYDKAIAFDPENFYGYYNLGLTSSNLKKPLLAIEYYRKAIEISPNKTYTNLNILISDCYMDLKKFQEAKEYLERYLIDFPEDENAFSKLQKIYKSIKITDTLDSRELPTILNVYQNTFYLINTEKSNNFFLSNVKTFMEKIKIPIVDNIENAESVIIIQPYDYISEEYLFQIIHKLEERKIPYQINLMDEEFSLPIKFQSKKAVQVITNIREKLINEYTEKIFSFSSFETLQNNIQFFLFNKPTTSLKIISLELKNIGLFEDATFQFHKKATVLVGLNGTGKTTILRSLGLGLIGSHHDSTPLDSIRSLLDIKQWSQENQKKENGIIKVTCEINSKIIETEIVLSVNEESGKITCSSKGTSNLFNGAFLKVPMIGFGQQRKQFSPTEKKKDFVDVSFPSINDITNLINNNEDDRLHSFVSWIANIKNESQKKGKENKAELIFLAFQIFSEIADEIIQFQELKNIDPLNLWITTKESPSGIPIEYSSQGFQTIMGWIGYIIERMNEAYPSSKDFKSEPAIVIIDEIDSFLHPKWQQNVLKVLMKTFPNMQIIASSHSPIVIDGLDKNQVIALRYNEKYKKIEAKVNLVDIWAWDYEEILLKLFDVYQIPKEYQAAVIEKMEAIRSKPFQTEKDKKELEDYQRLLDRLEESRIYNNEIEQIKKTLKEKEAQLDRLIEKYEKKV